MAEEEKSTFESGLESVIDMAAVYPQVFFMEGLDDMIGKVYGVVAGEKAGKEVQRNVEQWFQKRRDRSYSTMLTEFAPDIVDVVTFGLASGPSKMIKAGKVANRLKKIIEGTKNVKKLKNIKAVGDVGRIIKPMLKESGNVSKSIRKVTDVGKKIGMSPMAQVAGKAGVTGHLATGVDEKDSAFGNMLVSAGLGTGIYGTGKILKKGVNWATSDGKRFREIAKYMGADPKKSQEQLSNMKRVSIGKQPVKADGTPYTAKEIETVAVAQKAQKQKIGTMSDPDVEEALGKEIEAKGYPFKEGALEEPRIKGQRGRELKVEGKETIFPKGQAKIQQQLREKEQELIGDMAGTLGTKEGGTKVSVEKLEAELDELAEQMMAGDKVLKGRPERKRAMVDKLIKKAKKDLSKYDVEEILPADPLDKLSAAKTVTKKGEISVTELNDLKKSWYEEINWEKDAADEVTAKKQMATFFKDSVVKNVEPETAQKFEKLNNQFEVNADMVAGIDKEVRAKMKSMAGESWTARGWILLDKAMRSAQQYGKLPAMQAAKLTREALDKASKEVQTGISLAAKKPAQLPSKMMRPDYEGEDVGLGGIDEPVGDEEMMFGPTEVRDIPAEEVDEFEVDEFAEPLPDDDFAEPGAEAGIDDEFAAPLDEEDEFAAVGGEEGVGRAIASMGEPEMEEEVPMDPRQAMVEEKRAQQEELQNVALRDRIINTPLARNSEEFLKDPEFAIAKMYAQRPDLAQQWEHMLTNNPYQLEEHLMALQQESPEMLEHDPYKRINGRIVDNTVKAGLRRKIASNPELTNLQRVAELDTLNKDGVWKGDQAPPREASEAVQDTGAEGSTSGRSPSQIS